MKCCTSDNCNEFEIIFCFQSMIQPFLPQLENFMIIEVTNVSYKSP